MPLVRSVAIGCNRSSVDAAKKKEHEVVERRASGGGLQLDQPPTLRLDVAFIDHVISDVVIHEIFRAQ